MRTLSSKDGRMADRPTGRKAGALPPAAMNPYKAVTKGGNNMAEIWKDIEGYEGMYQVSNIGNVRSLNYRGTGIVRNLVPKVNNCGRLWVELKGKSFLIHRLVAKAFIPNIHNYPEINHKDENPKNNVVTNLEWCTGEYNRKMYSAKNSHGRPNTRQREINQLDTYGNLVKKWKDSRTIMNSTGMSQWSITQCCDGKRKTAYGFKWQYAI